MLFLLAVGPTEKEPDTWQKKTLVNAMEKRKMLEKILFNAIDRRK